MNQKLLEEYLDQLDNMKIKDKTKITGKVRLRVFSKEGELLQDTGVLENVITDTGKAAIAGLAINVGSIPAFTYLAVGSGTTNEAASQTALVTEITNHGLARMVADTPSRTTTTVTNDTSSLETSWTVTTPGGDTINEVGIFNNTLGSGTSIMLGRKKLSTGLSVVTGNVVVGTYVVSFA